MRNFKIALIMTRRFAVENIIYILMLCVSVTTSFKLVQHIEEYATYKKSVLSFKSDLISPKGNQIEQINSLLKINTKSEEDFKDYIPYTLYTTLANDRHIQFEDGQGYSSAKQQYLPLAPYLFLNSNVGLAIATEESFYKMFFPNNTTEFPNDDYVSIPYNIAHQKSLKIGDTIIIKTNLNANLTEAAEIPLKIKSIHSASESPWSQLTVVSLKFILEQLKNKQSAPQMIWKNQVINGVLVDSTNSSSQDARNNLDSLVNKRTVAVYSHSDKLIESAFRIMGFTSEKEAQQNYLIILLGLIGLLTLGFFHTKSILKIKKHLQQSLYENNDINLILALSLLIVTLPAIGLSWIFIYLY